MLHLYHATRDELIRIILKQRDALADRDRQITALIGEQTGTRQLVTDLTAQVGKVLAASARHDEPPGGTPWGMPGLKPTEPDGRPPRPRKRRAALSMPKRASYKPCTCPAYRWPHKPGGGRLPLRGC